MPVDKVTSAQFRSQLQAGITQRNNTFDTAFGPIRDIVIDPMAAVLERQNDRIRQVSLLVSLINSADFSESDLEALVFNEGLVRREGAPATGTIVFVRSAALPVASPDVVVQRGFPVATLADEATGLAITFVTTETASMTTTNQSTLFVLDRDRFELPLAVTATIDGTDGVVGPNRITRQLRPLSGFESVTNLSGTSGGRDRETNTELIERFLLAILGRDLATPVGLERGVRDEFGSVADVLTVHGSNPLLTRTGADAGAVDVFIVGDDLLSRTDTITFLGINQLMQVALPPLRSVESVVEGATTYIEDTDYEVVFDTTNLDGSNRAAEGIRFLSTATSTLPDVGDPVIIEYTSNNLIRNLQTTFEQDDRLVFGRDLLFKEGIQVNIILAANLTVVAGFSATDVQSVTVNAVSTFINALELGDNVEESDIQGVVRRISGVDNFVITRLVRDATVTGAADVVIADNEFARIAQADLTVTLV